MYHINTKMEEVDEKQRLIRVVIFLGIVGVAGYFLYSASTRQQDAQSNVLGEEVLDLPGIIEEKVVPLLPEKLRNKIEEAKVSEKIETEKQKIVESELVKEIQTEINKITEEIQGFPEKQKEEAKKEVIRQVCSELLKEEGE